MWTWFSLFLIQFLFSVFLPLKSSAAETPVPWNDLEPATNYRLLDPLYLSSSIHLEIHHPLTFIELQSDLEKVFFFVFKDTQCNNPQAQSELILFPSPNDPTIIMGAQYLKDCFLGLYLEPRDFFATSPFEATPVP